MPQDPNAKRLPVYLSSEELQLVRVAAAYDGRSMAAFAKEHLLTAARRVIAEHTQSDRTNHPS